jgi:Sap-like sulfolipid-1-addressing protein
MGAAIGDVLGLAAGVAVSPLPIVAMILLLATPRGRGRRHPVRRRLAGRPDHPRRGRAGAAAGGAPVARPARRGGGAGDAQVDGEAGPAATRRALGLGALLSAVNPKNGGLTVAAAATIAGAGLAGGSQAVVLAVFVLVGSVGVLAPLVVYLVAGQGAAATLDSWRTWAAGHNAAVMAVLFLVFAASSSATASPCCPELRAAAAGGPA